MRKQQMGLTEEIEMSVRTEGCTKKNIRSSLSADQIPKQAYQIVFQLLREDFSIKRYKKTQVTNPGLLYFNPLTFKMGVWNFTIIMTCYFLQTQISLTLAFGPSFWKNELQHFIYYAAYVTLLVLLALDMFVNFHKGYYAFGYGKVIENKQLIIKRYLKFHFWLDLACLALLCIPLFYSSYTLNFIQIISIALLFVRKFRCQTEIVRSLQYYANAQIFFVIAMLGCDVMQLGNFGACIFLGIDLLLWRLQFFGNNPQYYWLSNDSSYSINLMSGPWIAQYVYAQSFSTGTLSTLAPGPFGKNPIEISYELFVMIFFMILASYVGQVLVSILYANAETRIFHENNIQKFDDFMRLKKVVSLIKSRVQNFFQLIWEFEIKLNTEKQQQLIHNMPVTIREDLLMQTGFTKEISFLNFFSLSSEELQKLISYKIVSNIADPDATIFQIGSGLGDGFIYFIKSGLTKFYFPFKHKGSTISLSNVQRLLGQYEFITGTSFAYCCKSIDLCMIEKLSAIDLMAIIKSTGLIQQFHILKCDTLIYESLKHLNQTCLICDGLHRQNGCPMLSIRANIESNLSQQQSICAYCTKNQERRKLKRRQYKQSNVCRIRREEINETIAQVERSQGLKTDVNKALQLQSDEIRQYWKYYADYNIY